MDSATGSPPQRVLASIDATEAVLTARRGLRRDVAGLIQALDQAALILPLAKRIEGVDVGTLAEVGEELSLSPHLLFDENRVGYVAVFTQSELLERATAQVHWSTSDGPLEYCTLPAAVVLELALALIDGERVRGMLVNACHESELILHRHELASIAQGRALPLVGYVVDIPPGEDEGRLIAEMDAPPSREITAAIEQVLAETSTTLAYGIHRTFNPERDLEPHLTLNVRAGEAPVDRAVLAARLGAALDGKLPPPGYIDIVFDDPMLP